MKVKPNTHKRRLTNNQYSDQHHHAEQSGLNPSPLFINDAAKAELQQLK